MTTSAPPLHRGLSSDWRADASADRARELASVLRGADTLIGHMGSDLRVVWATGGLSRTDFARRIVALDYAPLEDSPCPFPGPAVDQVIGYAAHEGGHCLWTPAGSEHLLTALVDSWPERVPAGLRQDWDRDRETTLAALCNIHNVLEDAYVDAQISRCWPVLGEYVHIARAALDAALPLDAAAVASQESPDRGTLVNLWVWAALYGHVRPTSASAPIAHALDGLMACSESAAAMPDAADRLALTLEAAGVLWAFPQGDGPLQSGVGREPADAPDPGNKPASLAAFDSRSGAAARSSSPVPAHLLAAPMNTVDLTASVARDLRDAVCAAARDATYDAALAAERLAATHDEAIAIARILRLPQANGRWQPGTTSGQLDDRRLWRPFAGDTAAYRRRAAPSERRFAIGLLLDASGSMRPHTAIIEETAATFLQALVPLTRASFAVWCYTGEPARTVLTTLCSRADPQLRLGDVARWGQTPSGAAIAAAKALLLAMPERRKMLLHFTDGEPDDPAHVTDALHACRTAGVAVFAVGLERHRAMLARQYGDRLATIASVSELPSAAAAMLAQLARG